MWMFLSVVLGLNMVAGFADVAEEVQESETEKEVVVTEEAEQVAEDETKNG